MADAEDNVTLTQALAVFGLRHEADDSYPGRRAVFCDRGQIGVMNASEAWLLLTLLQSMRIDGICARADLAIAKAEGRAALAKATGGQDAASLAEKEACRG